MGDYWEWYGCDGSRGCGLCLEGPEGACRGASSSSSVRRRHRCDTHDMSLAPLLLRAGVSLGKWVHVAGSGGWLAAWSTGGEWSAIAQDSRRMRVGM